jgi:uroporphyrinogen-III synthase
LAEAGRLSVLITRPEPGASETAARVQALGMRAILAPMLRIEPRRGHLPPAGSIAAILATSGNALDALPEAYRSTPLYVVGAATGRRATRGGFIQVESADGDAEALAQLVVRLVRPSDGPLLLVSGERQGLHLAATLRARGHAVMRRVTYASVPETRLADPAVVLLRERTPHVALFFSAQTAQAYVRVVQRAALARAVETSEAVAIGEAASVALGALPWRRIRVAARPNQDEMLALLR